MDMNSDVDWTPPSEAEMKVIQAKRERADKISSLMGAYLLKGYKMLNETCPKCSTILLRDKQDELYCVACMELDADTEKDNPASSAEAARRLVAESQYSSPGAGPAPHTPDPDQLAPQQPSRAASSRSSPPPAEPTTPNTPSVSVRPRTHLTTRLSANGAQTEPPQCNGPLIWNSTEVAVAVNDAMASVARKLSWTTLQLDQSAVSVETSRQLVALVKECAEAMQALKKAAT